jgi:arsenical pump membrane protein
LEWLTRQPDAPRPERSRVRVAISWTVAAVATASVIIRPFDWPEAVWAVTGAALLVLSGLISPADALAGVASGADVYLFLVPGRHDAAGRGRAQRGAVRLARGRGRDLGEGLGAPAVHAGLRRRNIVTVFLSNDATAVVLTPAVAAAVRAAKAPHPLPYLLICAFVANAASFVLPISNPANLVVHGSRMPALMDWLPRYLLPSVLAIAATYVVLRWTQRADLREPLAAALPLPHLTAGGKAAALGIAATAAVLLASSVLDNPLACPPPSPGR